ncbi:YhgE/Pip domain-containing protein [Macrococcus brunensis]|uniref:YhgE/Pip domain-containing protein n=1 Tax=Macrococcus brunensis TaxID=198483 RepID=UPI001EF15DD9|nr:YhgE/Pip domain-containing protein [Macrococcus brunensis]ULG72872.1 YhgE/Pip domain-containing protein [Macrococcus brunensis]
MKKIFSLFIKDVQHALKTPMVLIVILGLCILPSFYAWFNLKSSWDPYSNTKGIKVAVVNFDEGATVQGKHVNVGKSLVKELKTNDQFGWVFVDSLKDAKQGVRLGKYYAMIHIPEHFSEDMTSIFDKKPKRAHIDYQVNQKINAIAPKMTTAGATAITKTLNDKFVEAATQAFLKESNSLGIDLEKKLPLYHKIENAVFQAEAAIPKMEKFSAAVQKIDAHQGDINQYAEEFYALESYKDEINSGAAKLIKANQHAGEINEAGQMIVGLNSKMSNIEAALNKAQQFEERFPEINAAVAKGIDATNKASEVLSTAQNRMPQVHARLNQAQDATSKADTKVESAEEKVSSEEVDTEEKVTTEGSSTQENQTTSSEQKIEIPDSTEAVTTESVTTELPSTEAKKTATMQTVAKTKDEPLTQSDLEPAKQALSEALRAMAGLVKDNAAAQKDTLSALKDHQPSKDNMKVIAQNIGQTIQLQKEVADVLQQSSIDTSQIEEALNNSNNALAVVQKQLENGQIDASSISRAEEALSVIQNMDMQSILLQGLETIDSGLDTAAMKLRDAEQFANKVDGILTEAQQVTSAANERLVTINNELPALEERFKEVNANVQSNFPAFKARVAEASQFVQNELPGVLNDLSRISHFAQNDLPGVMSKYDETADLLRNNLPGAEKGIHDLAEFSRNDLPGIEKDIKKAADKFRELDKKDVMNKLIKLLRNDLQGEADYFSDPIQLDEKQMFPIPNYGSASAPFYTALALWVGALLSSNLLTTELKDQSLKGIYSLRELFAGRLLLFLSIGIIQSVIVVIGNFFILDAYAKHPVMNLLFAVLVSIVFTSIVYTMVSLLGNVGKALAIILMVLQISGGGGTFPVQVTPHFFQMIHPFLPFTYAVDLLREAVGGIVPELVTLNISRLLIFFIGILAIGYGLKPKFEPIKKRMIKTSEESTIVE